ncbi:MAG: beta-N-acetylhexosaminidase [Methylobacteriaceae bacterium]|nr:beta-N-acetylhexosaminidase [Methylobacteriaceae bacterium]MCO5086744.1 beta-N-acetylhexosaminidase [Methylobacteriaceae bacterium]
MAPRAFICGCSSTVLTADEEAFIRQSDPWGLILFKRNVADRAQMRALTDRFRELTGRTDAAVLIDQEGGRVQRMAADHWPAYPSAARLAATATDSVVQVRNVFLAARLIAHDLAEVGVNVDCLPVLDLPVPGSHAIIGDRAYGEDPETVARLGRAAAEGLIAGGVLPVFKHVPGHGRARADSHLELPTVETSREELERSDFAPFRANADLPVAMTAHVVFKAIDPDRPATLSPIVVNEIIRGFIGFDGLLMSDDLSMKALAGTFRDRARALFAAGVDIALHCNGDLAEAGEVAAEAPELSGKARERAEKALARIAGERLAFDPVDSREKLAAALASAA